MTDDLERPREPYRDGADADIVYRRSSKLAKWSPAFAGLGIALFAVLLGLAVWTFPWEDARYNWTMFGLLVAWVAALLVPIFAQERLHDDPRLVDPSGDVERADKVIRVGMSAIAIVGIIVVVLPFALVAIWIVAMMLGLADWPFG